jgi:Pyridine nucleotide-disulphide oxidoreductase
MTSIRAIELSLALVQTLSFAPMLAARPYQPHGRKTAVRGRLRSRIGALDPNETPAVEAALRDALERAAPDKAMDGMTERLEIADDGKPPTAPSRRPHIVIIGAGFGGLSAATGLGRAAAAVTVIDQRNHHLFQPLLYQVATAALSPADIAAPIRGILSRQANTEVMLGIVTGIDVAGRAVLIGERRIPYDQLVIATGARESYFGHDEWAAVTSGLKTIEDAAPHPHRIRTRRRLRR